MIPAPGLKPLFARIGGQSAVRFRVEFADGTHYQNGEGPFDLTVRFKTRSAEWRAVLSGYLGILAAYFEDTLDFEGDLKQAFRAAFESRAVKATHPAAWIRNRVHELRHSNRSYAQAKANARFHYGLGTEFFRYWLDRELMMYTCAYWKEGTRNVEQAQVNKVDHVCRKLRLEPGESVADVGCGFGGFMFRAHQAFGAKVVGCNTTTEQVDYVREEIERRRLADALEVHELDFREFRGQFDKCAHIGVLEHAGRHELDATIRAMADLLKPGGLGVLHFIGHVSRFDTEPFIREYIFPGGWIPSLAEAMERMEAHGLEILDVENLRRHYALTLDAWGERFDRHWEDIQRLDPKRFDERFRRIWRVYLYGCAENFRSTKSRLHLFQVIFSKGNVGYDYPMSRAYLYADDLAQVDDRVRAGQA